MKTSVPGSGALLLTLVIALLAPGVLAAQSVLDRTPNLSGAWVGEPGVVHFNFLHRFDLASGKVLNSPTFLLAVPLPGRTLVGINYASNTRVARGEVNEFELLGRWAPLSVDDGWPVDAGLTLAYNDAAESVDGEVTVTLPLGPLRLIGAGRYLSSAFDSDESRWAGGGGLALTLHRNLAVAADVTALQERAGDEDLAWGVGIQTRIPFTPHTFSLQAANTRTGTLQGSSVGLESGGEDQILYGFEFTVPFTLSRYFGGGGDEERTTTGEGDVAAEVTMTNQLRYVPGTVRIRAGETVRWRNTTPLIHTVTADPARAMNPEESVSLPTGADAFDSGELEPDQVFEHTFDVPGEYRYFCVPHEGAAMVGTVIVEG